MVIGWIFGKKFGNFFREVVGAEVTGDVERFAHWGSRRDWGELRHRGCCGIGGSCGIGGAAASGITAASGGAAASGLLRVQPDFEKSQVLNIV